MNSIEQQYGNTNHDWSLKKSVYKSIFCSCETRGVSIDRVDHAYGLCKFVCDGLHPSRGNWTVETSLHAFNALIRAAILLSHKLISSYHWSIRHALPVLYKFARDRLYPCSTRVDWTTGASLHALYCELVCKVKA